MLPVLFHVGDTAVPTYYLLMVLGFAGAWGLALHLGPGFGLTRRQVVDAAVAATVWGTLGGKLGHCLLEAEGHLLPDGGVTDGVWDLMSADPWHWARLFDGGYVWYGGLLLATAVLWVRSRGGRVDRAALADTAAPGVAFGILVGRVGCFLGGCCYGSETEVAWAVRFPSGAASELGAIHPVQLYDATFGLLLLALLLWRAPRRRFAGELFALLMVIYPAVRLVMELFRGDAERQLYLGGALSTSQLISLAILPASVYFLVQGYRGRLSRRGASPPASGGKG